jgi:DNA-binding NtrC family response regulator
VESRKVDVRILAATNEDIRRLVDDGSFREDLYYRLNVLNVVLPPLRERMEDLALLAEHFLRHYNTENDKQIERLAPEVIERMLSYSWPGNVRQLENVIERGVVLAVGDEITPDLLPPELRVRSAPPGPGVFPDGMDLNRAVARFERELIEAAMERAGGVQKHAAHLLGLKPTTLNEKLKRLKAEARPG